MEYDSDAKLLKCQCNSCQNVQWLKNAKLLSEQQAVMNQLQLEDIFEIEGKFLG